jgi:tetratricopeptide (TPR) repeat protein
VQKAEKRGDAAARRRASKALTEMRVGEARRGVERNPADFGARFELGSGLLADRRRRCGDRRAAAGVKDPRKKNEALFLLGKPSSTRELPELALGQFDKALHAAGSGVLAKESLYEMGLICLSTGKREDALRHFSRILEQDIGFRDVAARWSR